MSAEVILEAEGLTRSFAVREGLLRKRQLRAVDGVDLTIATGETLGIVGESGCGKSTLARLLLGLLEPTTGEVRFLGQRLEPAARAVRKDLQIVFQDPYSSLNPRMTVGEIVERPLIVHRIGSPAERRQRVAELFNWVGLPPESTSRYPHEFSGGQRQRVAVARAIATRPRLIVADEPTSALDVSVQAKVLNLLKDLQDALSLTYVLISHDMRVVRHMCDRVAVMYLGRLVEQGPTEEVFQNPRHPYTRVLLGAVPSTRRGRERARIAVEGEPPSPLSPPSGCPFHPRCGWAIDECRMSVPALRALEVRPTSRPAAWTQSAAFPGPEHLAACHLAEDLS